MSLFLSDLHLGHPMCKAERLAKFIGNQRKDQTLYLVGDVIDDAAVKKWPKQHLDVVRYILSFLTIVYVPGNHDEFMASLIGLFGPVTVFDNGFYVTDDGRKYLLTHGHQYDPSLILTAPRFFRRNWPMTGRLHTKALSGFLQGRVVRAVKAIGCDGAICGHTHHPDNKMVDGVHYLNCGDWFYSCTAITEHDGEFKLIKA